MSDWKTLLGGIDDDYLVGISNKGIVKRAYKDKEEYDCEVLSIEDEVQVRVGEETVHIRNPLGESKCSCPSRSICRHVILAILILKETVSETKEESIETTEKHDIAAQDTLSGTEQDMVQMPSAGQEEDLHTKLKEEIENYPLEQLRRQLGQKAFQGFVGQVKAGIKPQIDDTSVIFVKLPKQDMTVKLLYPLEYSTCTCHKKEFCIHKAMAVLWCKQQAGQIKPADLEQSLEEKPDLDKEQIQDAALQMKTFLEELMSTGLSRTSPDVLDYLERLAIISHNAKLANFEGYWRALLDSYQSYLKRKSSFRVVELMQQLTRLYRRVELLLQAEGSMQLMELAGEFKAKYHPVGNLELIGIAVEHFESQTGYEGETIYFLEENTKKWYTYTAARPKFYDNSAKTRRGMTENALAPWQLSISLENMVLAKIRLTNAKCDERFRLSSSQETKGELLAERQKGNRLCAENLGSWYYRDFQSLFLKQIEPQKRSWLREQSASETKGTELVFVRPASCEKAVFSPTEQKLYMSLFDENGRELVIEVAYSKNESWGIRYLERLTNENLPCFLGKVWLREGKIRMYPVAAFEKGELIENGTTE